MNRDGTPSSRYDSIKKINGEVRGFAKYLYSAKVLKTYQSGDISEDGKSQTERDKVRVLEEIPTSIGLFRGAKGENFALIANRDYRNPQKPKLSMKIGSSKVEMLELKSGKWLPIGGSKRLKEKTLLTLSLKPAEATLIRWK